MKNSYNKDPKRQIISAVALPFIIFFWMTGWILYCIGAQKTLPKSTPKEQFIPQKTTQKGNAAQEIIEPQILA